MRSQYADDHARVRAKHKWTARRITFTAIAVVIAIAACVAFLLKYETASASGPIGATWPVRVVLLDVSEVREIHKPPPSPGMPLSRSGGIVLGFHVRMQGRDLAQLSPRGKFRLDEAVDDLGDSLTWAGNDRFRAITFNLDRVDPAVVPDPTRGGVTTDFSANAAPRTARKIARLRGAIEAVIGGEQKALRFSLRSRVGSDLVDATLQKAGIEKIHISEQKSEGYPGEIADFVLTVSGDASALRNADICGKGDSKITTGAMFDNGNWTIGINQPLDDNTILRLQVAVRQKKLVVPVEFKDITLP